MLTSLLILALYCIMLNILKSDLPAPVLATSPVPTKLDINFNDTELTNSEIVQFLVTSIPGLTTADQLKPTLSTSIESAKTLLSSLPPKG